MYLKQGDEVSICDCLGRLLHERQCRHVAYARHQLKRGRRGVGDSEDTGRKRMAAVRRQRRCINPRLMAYTLSVLVCEV